MIRCNARRHRQAVGIRSCGAFAFLFGFLFGFLVIKLFARFATVVERYCQAMHQTISLHSRSGTLMRSSQVPEVSWSDAGSLDCRTYKGRASKAVLPPHPGQTKPAGQRKRANADTLARIPDYKITKVDDLLPWKWRA